MWNDNVPTVIDWESSGYVNPTVELVQYAGIGQMEMLENLILKSLE